MATDIPYYFSTWWYFSDAHSSSRVITLLQLLQQAEKIPWIRYVDKDLDELKK